MLPNKPFETELPKRAYLARSRPPNDDLPLPLRMNVYDKGFFTILFCSALLVLIAVPLALRMVPRNVVYGFRTHTTLSDDAIWFEANAHFGRRLLVSSLCGALLAYLIYPFQPISLHTFLPISVFILIAPTLLVATLNGSVYPFDHLRRLAAPTERPDIVCPPRTKVGLVAE